MNVLALALKFGPLHSMYMSFFIASTLDPPGISQFGLALLSVILGCYWPILAPWGQFWAILWIKEATDQHFCGVSGPGWCGFDSLLHESWAHLKQPTQKVE